MTIKITLSTGKEIELTMQEFNEMREVTGIRPPVPYGPIIPWTPPGSTPWTVTWHPTTCGCTPKIETKGE